MNRVEEFINAHWDECTMEIREDDGVRIGLPYPYSIPAPKKFVCMYYWDTYFTNLGLLQSGRAMMAKCNVDNMLYLVNKYGFMPNGNKEVFLSRSQPPYLSEMVKDVYEYYKDPVWLRTAYEILGKEYEFWMTKRMSPIGLNKYACDLSPEMIVKYAKWFGVRIGFRPDGTDEEIANHAICNAESGWDENRRWGFEGYNYAHIDVNCLLYMFENNMAEFANILGISEERQWIERAMRRHELMNKYMTDDSGIFYDYNFKTKELSPVFSVASFYPLFAKIANKKQAQAIVDNLYRLEEKFGLSTCERSDSHAKYQWDYPNGWPCMQFVAVKGLASYGYVREAARIAEKYISTVEKVFEETGNLWEKYNVTDGSINVTNEYEMPPMMGWTAGVYIAIKNLYS